MTDFFVHSQGLVDEGAQVGSGTRVWAFAHINSGAVVGEDCNICDHTFIETGVLMGNRVTVKCGVHLWSGVTVEDDVFIGPNATFTNDRVPRSKVYPSQYANTVLRVGCSIGANATMLPGLEVGECALVGAGSVVTTNIPAHALVYGNPARIKGWVCACGEKLSMNENAVADCCGKTYHLTNGVLEVSSVA
ncbi:Hexapeptide repeat of succinyl-transferase [Mariprofundus aestuarium]|uniref:Hexapeptide repeat of succinyl-transferase n=1 Tax=Mariprofundus aestuarium TaxID=1921086 RepID=A0A2K8L384_MARES|nr:acyltransferase [Mariprofundus aestuarium]ATX80301.1 Hexapeptide repeat of succinyl-transferase [Mariprofundus aestuarium]